MSLREARGTMPSIRVCCILLVFLSCALLQLRAVEGLRHVPGSVINQSPYELSYLHKKHGKHGGGDTECDTLEFRQSLLTMIKEMPLIGLFEDIRGQTKFEASGMTIAKDHLWIVFDNLHALGRVNEQFAFRDNRNKLVGVLGEDSQFESLSYAESTGHFYAIEEVFEGKSVMHPFTHEIKITDDGASYELLDRCPVHFELKHQNKGFEGIHYYETESGDKYLLGLCEGNYCEGGRKGRETGNGRIVLSKFNGKTGEECGWDVVKTIDIPSTADFMDYSGMAVRGNRMAILSQENSAVWVGTFDFEKMDFDSEGTVYNFPRDNHCDMIYCNVEGVEWVDDVRLVIASDKAKKDQPFRCVQKEQRVHIFALPEGAEDQLGTKGKVNNA